MGVKVGKYTHTISNAHVYDIHYEAAEEMIKRKNKHLPVEIKAEKNWFSRAEKGDEELVAEIVEELNSQYQPGEALKGLKIVL
jgi:thymidylate synthase